MCAYGTLLFTIEEVKPLKHLLERVIMKTFVVKLLVIKFLYHRLESGGLSVAGSVS